MRRALFPMNMAVVLLAVGCANPDRSRDLANPAVSSVTLAQQVCSNCHGVTGNAVSPNFPNLAAQMPDYVIAQLKGFRNHHRRDPAGFEYMWGLSRSLTDDQIDGLARYYAGQHAVRQPLEAPPSRAIAGRTIFESGIAARGVPACSSCHGAHGAGTGAYPRIAGQHADYLVKQLLVFQRTNERPEGSVMKTVAHELSEDDIRNVAAYLQSTSPP